MATEGTDGWHFGLIACMNAQDGIYTGGMASKGYIRCPTTAVGAYGQRSLTRFQRSLWQP